MRGICLRAIGRNGGVLTKMPADFAALLGIADSKLFAGSSSSPASRCFTAGGDELTEEEFELIENGDVLYISCGEDFLLSGSKVGPAPASPALICRTAEPPEHQSDKLPTSAPPNRGDQWTDIVGLTRTAQKEPKARRFLDLAPSLLTVLKQVHPTLGLSDGAASMVSSVLNYCVDCLVDELGLAAQLKAAALPPGQPRAAADVADVADVEAALPRLLGKVIYTGQSFPSGQQGLCRLARMEGSKAVRYPSRLAFEIGGLGQTLGRHLSAEAEAYLGGVVEFLGAEMLEVSGHEAKRRVSTNEALGREISTDDVCAALRADAELAALVGGGGASAERPLPLVGLSAGMLRVRQVVFGVAAMVDGGSDDEDGYASAEDQGDETGAHGALAADAASPEVLSAVGCEIDSLPRVASSLVWAMSGDQPVDTATISMPVPETGAETGAFGFVRATPAAPAPPLLPPPLPPQTPKPPPPSSAPPSSAPAPIDAPTASAAVEEEEEEAYGIGDDWDAEGAFASISRQLSAPPTPADPPASKLPGIATTKGASEAIKEEAAARKEAKEAKEAKEQATPPPTTPKAVVAMAMGEARSCNGAYAQVAGRTHEGKPVYKNIGNEAIIYYSTTWAPSWKMNAVDSTAGWLYSLKSFQVVVPMGRWGVGGVGQPARDGLGAGPTVSSPSTNDEGPPRPLRKGDRVTRGPQWKWDEQDGVAGTLGTVIKDVDESGWVQVAWDGKGASDARTFNYRTPAAGAQDLELVSEGRAVGEDDDGGGVSRPVELPFTEPTTAPRTSVKAVPTVQAAPPSVLAEEIQKQAALEARIVVQGDKVRALKAARSPEMVKPAELKAAIAELLRLKKAAGWPSDRPSRSATGGAAGGATSGATGGATGGAIEADPVLVPKRAGGAEVAGAEADAEADAEVCEEPTSFTFDKMGKDALSFDAGAQIKKTKSTDSHCLASPALTNGYASVQFHLDFEPESGYSDTFGVFVADLEKLKSSVSSAVAKSVALKLEGKQACKISPASSSNPNSNASFSSDLGWGPLAKGDVVEFAVDFDGNGADAKVSVKCKGKSEVRIINGVPPCGLAFGVGLYKKDHGVTLKNGARLVKQPVPPLPSGARVDRVRFITLETRAEESAVQLSRLRLSDEWGRPIELIAASNPRGQSPTSVSNEAGKAFDGLTSTKWLEKTGYGPTMGALEAVFAAGAAVVGSYALTTADDFEGRDPVRWRLEAKRGAAPEWAVLDDKTAGRQAVPTARLAEWAVSIVRLRAGTHVRALAAIAELSVPQSVVGLEGVVLSDEGGEQPLVRVHFDGGESPVRAWSVAPRCLLKLDAARSVAAAATAAAAAVAVKGDGEGDGEVPAPRRMRSKAGGEADSAGAPPPSVVPSRSASVETDSGQIPSSVVVSGAGSAEWNGVYAREAAFANSARFAKDAAHVLHRATHPSLSERQKIWKLGHPGKHVAFHVLDTTLSASRPPATGWVVAGDLRVPPEALMLPSPTVSIPEDSAPSEARGGASALPGGAPPPLGSSAAFTLAPYSEWARDVMLGLYTQEWPRFQRGVDGSCGLAASKTLYATADAEQATAADVADPLKYYELNSTVLGRWLMAEGFETGDTAVDIARILGLDEFAAYADESGRASTADAEQLPPPPRISFGAQKDGWCRDVYKGLSEDKLELFKAGVRSHCSTLAAAAASGILSPRSKRAIHDVSHIPLLHSPPLAPSSRAQVLASGGLVLSQGLYENSKPEKLIDSAGYYKLQGTSSGTWFRGKQCKAGETAYELAKKPDLRLIST